MTRRPILLIILILLCNLFFIGGVISQEKAPPPPTELTDPADPQPPEAGSPFLREFLNMLMILGFIIVVMIALGWVLKRLLRQRMMNANKGSIIKIVERRALAPKTAIYVVEIAGKGLIIGESPQGLHRLGELSEQEEGKTFRNILEQGDA